MFTTQTRMLGLFATAALAAVATAAAPASAATTTSSLDVSATVSASCSVSTTAVSFGDVAVLAGTNDDATGGLSVTCTNGTAWSASASAGSGSGATLTDRKMTSGTNLLSYDLYTDSGHTVIWGDAADTTTAKFSGTGTGSAQANTIYARVPSGQNTARVGSYADAVTVTVTY